MLARSSWWVRLRERPLELELLVTASLLLAAGLGAIILGSGDTIQWMDLAIAGAFVGLFIGLSLALAIRGWGEDAVLLPLAACLAGIGMIMTRRLEPDLAARYGEL